VGPKDTVDGTVNMVGPSTRGQPNGEADVGVSQGSALRPLVRWLVNRVPEDVHHRSSLRPEVRDRYPIQCRSPNNARPTRTIVAPSSTAMS